MARFTIEQMLNELRTIFLFEADHILLGAGPRTAAAFIGFEHGEEGEYCQLDPSRVDLGRFPITRAFVDGYEYAFRPSVLSALGENDVQDLTVFMLGTPRAAGIASGGETHAFMGPEGLCQTVADTVHARWKLEWDAGGMAGHTFTTRELALLANMTEGAVRNALADKSESGLRATPGVKPVSVDHQEAWRWLSARRGFIPSPERPREDRFLTEHLQETRSSEVFGKLISRLLWARIGTPDQASARLGWEVAEVQAWCAGSFSFDADRASHLGRALDLDLPLFVGKALEVSLRRDASLVPGGRA